ncbi:synaptic vesicular amine transporter-like [Haliotis rufescens]|uniref:synaptic vesicular amine transporter-like n=1 Tax=Haliotis rufescens TaxID=6454 RepID=UPI00201F8851|nr:synaptic vesicular amine transporter-like [Haliotis rufescens]
MAFERIRSIRRNCEHSTKLALFIVFYTNMLDSLLLTAVVPIIPDILLDLDEANFHSRNRTLYRNESGLSLNQTQSQSLTQKAFSLSVSALNENTKVGWLLSSKAIIQLIAGPLIGPLCNRVGYPIVLFCGCVVILASALIFACAEMYIPLFFARAVQGLGSAGTVIAGMSIVASRYPDDRARSGAMGLAMGGAAFGVLVGYPFGGFMYTFVGKVSPFLVICVLICVDLGLQWFVFNLSVTTENACRSTPLHKLLRDPYILIVSGIIMISTMAMSVLEPTVPLWILDKMHAEKWQLGLVFLPDSVGYLVGTNFFGIAARSIGRWITTLCCMLLIGLCLVCLPFATTVPQLILPHFGIGLGIGITDAALFPLLALLVDTRHDAFYGSVYAIAQLAVCLAYSIGPSVAGQIVKAIGFPWLIRGTAILNLLYCPLCLFLRKFPRTDEEIPVIMSHKTKTENYTKDADTENSSFSYGRLCEDD